MAYTGTDLNKAERGWVKSRGAVNVKDYGAVGDGVTDDTEKIQDAIDSVGASGGVISLGESGTYLITSSLVINNSNITLTGNRNTVLLVDFAGYAITSTNNNNLLLKGFSILGNSQIGDVLTGQIGTCGINIVGGSNIMIDGIKIDKMGTVVLPVSADASDAAWGGLGIRLYCSDYDLINITVQNCIITNIAGGGYATGDGIYVGNRALTHETKGIKIKDNYIYNTGRHSIGVSLLSGSISSNILVQNNLCELSSLSGIDNESGYDVIIESCTFNGSGTNTNFYDPDTVYGETFGLRGGVATTGNSDNVKIMKNVFNDCQYGLSIGNSQKISISHNTLNNSVLSDFSYNGARSPYNTTIDYNNFNTDLPISFYVIDDSYTIVSNNVFVGALILDKAIKMVITNNIFYNKLEFGAGTGKNDILVSTNLFFGVAGNGVIIFESDAATDVVIEDNIIDGLNSTTNGIYITYNSVKNLKITGNTIKNIVAKGISIETLSSYNAVDMISNNKFSGMADGIYIHRNLNEALISSNFFNDLSGTAIYVAVGTSSQFATNMSIIGNKGTSSVTNGIFANSIYTSNCIYTNNNFANAITTSLDLVADSTYGSIIKNNL